MNEAELLESLSLMVANSLAAYTIFLTLGTSYIVAAQLAGSTLTRSQIIILTLLYTMTTFVVLFTLHGHISLSDSLRAEQLTRFPRGGEIGFPVAPVSLISNLLIYFGTIKYMWDVRKKAAV